MSQNTNMYIYIYIYLYIIKKIQRNFSKELKTSKKIKKSL